MFASTTALLAGLGTFLLHSTLWIAGAWALAQVVRAPCWRERAWKASVVGALVSSALLLALGSSTLAWHLPGPAAIGAALTKRPPVDASIAPRATAVDAAPVETPSVPTPRAPLPWRQALVALWLLGGGVGLARLTRAHRAFARDLETRGTVQDGGWIETLETLRERAGIARAPRLSAHEALRSPIALARGEIVVPRRALAALPPAEREALLAHELAHLVRRDPVWRLALDVLACVLWFQPLLRLAVARVAEVAEPCSDDLALRWTRGELALARCLATVARWTQAPGGCPVPVTGMVERPSRLVERVERLLEPRTTPRGQGLAVGLWFTASLVALGCAGPAVHGSPRRDAPMALMLTGGTRVTLPAQTLALRDPGALAREPGDARITKAIEELDECPEARIAFHTTLSDEGPKGIQGAQEHALEFDADGTIRCGDMRLVLPDVDDSRLLRFHVAEIERVTGRPTEVGLARDTESSLLRKTLGDLATPPHGARRVDFLVRQPDGSVSRLPYAFSHPVTEGETAALWVRVEALDDPGDGLDRAYRYGMKDPGGPTPSTFVWTLAPGPELERIHRRAPDLRVIVDARPGTHWAQAKALIDLVVAAGFTDIAIATDRH